MPVCYFFNLSPIQISFPSHVKVKTSKTPFFKVYQTQTGTSSRAQIHTPAYMQVMSRHPVHGVHKALGLNVEQDLYRAKRFIKKGNTPCFQHIPWEAVA